MQKAATILVLSLLLSISSTGQTPPHSALYNSKLQLMADTAFSISQEQFAKWMSVEDSLCMNILEKLYYPIVSRENLVEGKMIVSFLLDTAGRFYDLRLEKYYADRSPDTTSVLINSFMNSAFSAIRSSSGAFIKNGFVCSKDAMESYYLPFVFRLNKISTYRKTENGYLVLDHKENKTVH